jgi:CheY-like chemotaxis protein
MRPGSTAAQKLNRWRGEIVHVESEVDLQSRFTFVLSLNQNLPPQTTAKNIMNRGVVLLAEDNRINSEMVSEYLGALGYQVIIAQNGEEVLEKASEIQPNIILMDIQMPKLDGLEATRLLRTDPRFASTPIIALTALAMLGDRERCFEAGVNEYLTKPLRLKKLSEIVEKLIG